MSLSDFPSLLGTEWPDSEVFQMAEQFQMKKKEIPKDCCSPQRPGDAVMLLSFFSPSLSPSSGPATFCVGTAGSHFNQMVGRVGLHGRGTSDSIGLCLELLKRTHHESS